MKIWETYVLWLRSHTSIAPSLTHANTVEDVRDHAMSGTPRYNTMALHQTHTQHVTLHTGLTWY